MTRYFIHRAYALFAAVAVTLCPLAASRAAAQEATSLSVTPPFFYITMSPGDYWASSVKVVNTNPRDLIAYPTLASFRAAPEGGYGQFTPVTDKDRDPATLPGWMDMSQAPVTVRPGASAEIPFTIRVPKDASPGGHYAAVLVGTEPSFGGGAQNGPLIRISSYVTALFFVRIQGDVKEEGDVREFSRDKDWYDEPSVNFTMKFENTGNVHIQPQGFIDIFDVFGRKRAEIPVNDERGYGNVLPQSVRTFSFSWAPERDLRLLGRYTAVLTLTYGKEARQSVTRTLVFWIVPLRETGIAVLALVLLLFGTRFVIRRSVRRALQAEMERRGGSGDSAVFGSRGAPPPGPPSGQDDLVDLRKRTGRRR